MPRKVKEKSKIVDNPFDLPESPQKEQEIKDKYEGNLTREQKQELLGINIYEDFYEIARRLDTHHAFFYKLWDMGIPRLTFEIPTAAVRFDRKGRQIEFLFNPIFWKESSMYKKIFVVCHECMHVLLNHGIRSKNCPLHILANIAMDVVVNHMLCDRFEFDREKIEGWKDLCWLDTTFSGFNDVQKEQIFEYYYGILEQNCKIIKVKVYRTGGSGSGSGGTGGEEISGEVLDDHDGLDSFDDQDAQDEIAEEIGKYLSEEEKEDLAKRVGETEEGKKASEQKASNSQNAGTVAGNFVYYANVKERVIKKRKWETVIQKWSLKYKQNDHNQEQWARLNRRLQLFKDHELLLPSEHEEENKEETKIDVYFFQDTSGSCSQFRDRFFHVAKSLPDDRFNIYLHCFDTEVYEVDIKVGKLKGFGGTSFVSIENFLQNRIKQGKLKKYPEAVFVITDGYSSDNVSPQTPRNWYWFLSENHKDCIPKESNVYLLKDYE